MSKSGVIPEGAIRVGQTYECAAARRCVDYFEVISIVEITYMNMSHTLYELYWVKKAGVDEQYIKDIVGIYLDAFECGQKYGKPLVKEY